MMRPLPLWFVLVSLFAASVTGCGADDDAPSPAIKVAPTCPTFATTAPETTRLLNAGRLPALKALLGQRLTDEQATAVVRGSLDIVQGIDSSVLDTFSQWGDHPSTGALGRGLVGLMDVIIGDPSKPDTFREDIILRVVDIATTCGGESILRMGRSLLETPEFRTFIEQLNLVIQLDAIEMLLRNEDARVSKEAFDVLITTIIRSLIRPNFSVTDDIATPIANLDLFPVDEPPVSVLIETIQGIYPRERHFGAPAGPGLLWYSWGADLRRSDRTTTWLGSVHAHSFHLRYSGQFRSRYRRDSQGTQQFCSESSGRWFKRCHR